MPFLLHVLLLDQTFSMGKAFRSVIHSTGAQLWVSPQEVLPGLLIREAEGSEFIHPGEEEADGGVYLLSSATT